MTGLTDRYERQLCLPQIGPAGQKRLAQARVLVAGAGGLGSPLLYALAGAGIGQVTILDPDHVSPGNLNRQFLYRADDIGRAKADCAARSLREYRPDLVIRALCEALCTANAADLLAGHDLIITATDNRASRLIANLAACQTGRPLVDGGVRGLNGTLAVIRPGLTPCWLCLYPLPDEGGAQDCSNRDGILGSVAATIGSFMATAALLLLLGQPDPLDGAILHIRSSPMACTRLPVGRDPACPVCARLWPDATVQMPNAAGGNRR
jgi:adenylyltransferase/sulfurtransferase